MKRFSLILKKSLLAVLLVGLVPAIASSAQQKTDSELFAEGRIALDKYKDCPTAKASFEAESSAAQDSAIWLDYSARASECSGNLDAALSYYERESTKLPATARLIDKIGDLQYRIKTQRDEAARGNQQQLEKNRQQAVLHSVDGPGLQQTIDYINSRGLGMNIVVSYESASLQVISGDPGCRDCNYQIQTVLFKDIPRSRVDGAVFHCPSHSDCVKKQLLMRRKNKPYGDRDGSNWMSLAYFFTGSPDGDQTERLNKAVQRLFALLEERFAAEKQRKDAADPFK